MRQKVEIGRPRQTMVAILDEQAADILARETLGQDQAALPGNVRVALAVQETHRTGEGDRCAQPQPRPAVLDQGACDRK